jgi:hypothetical protein
MLFKEIFAVCSENYTGAISKKFKSYWLSKQVVLDFVGLRSVLVLYPSFIKEFTLSLKQYGDCNCVVKISMY